jgi:hypothetical protein
MPALLAFVRFALTLDPFGEGTEMRCVLHACVSYVFKRNFGAPQNDIPEQARDKNPRPSRHSPLTKYN